MNNLINKCVRMISGSKGGNMPVYKYQTKEGTKWYVKSDNQTKRGFNTKKEALEYELGLKSGEIKQYPSFKKVTEDYIYTKESSDLTYGSINKMKGVINNYILPIIENKPIDLYSQRDCRDFKVKLKQQNSELCTKTLNYILQQYKAIFKHAVKYYDLERNPCEVLEPYKKTYKEKKKKKDKESCIWSPEEFNRFILYVKNPTYKIFFTTLFYTGLRLGEAQALTWEDFDGNYIYVNKSLTKKTNKGAYEIKEPKSVASIRKVSLGKSLSAYLSYYKSTQEKMDWFDDSLFIFGGPKPLPQTSITRQKDNAIKESGVKRIRVHDFRHSHASNLICNGCNIVAVSKRLGHESVDITLNVYTHLIPKKEDEAVTIVERYSQNLLKSIY